MLKKVIEHEKHVEATISRMSARAAFAFALACTERQWPVFERAMREKAANLRKPLDFRKLIDFGWDYCIRGTPIPNGISAACRSEIPDIGGDAPEAVIFTISNSIVDLLDMIQENDAASAYSVYGRNLDLIEVLLDEHSLVFRDLTENEAQDSPKVKRIRPLIMEEMRHQIKDLQDLNTKKLCAAAIQTVREESSGKSLFGEVWFS